MSHVGVNLGFGNLHENLTDEQMYLGELALAELTDRLGFDSLWAVEHHFDDYAMCPDNVVLLANVAARTERVKLGTGAVILPWNDPIRVAEKMIMLDIVSGGRALFGMGRGLSRMEYAPFGVEMSESRERFDEAAAMIAEALETGWIEGEATGRFGTVHVVCNNAGVGPMAPIAELTMADWHWIIGVNLYGVIHGVQTFLPILAANHDGGHIVNTASMAGLVAPPRLGAYSVTKFGVVALTEALAAELAAAGSAVGATVLCPGTVRSNIRASSRNRPAHLAGGGLADVDISLQDNPAYRWISPEDAGAVVVRAVKRGDLYALTHPDWYPMVERRNEVIAAPFRRAADDG